MKKEKSHAQFWMVLAVINILVLFYPINLLHSAGSNDEKPTLQFSNSSVFCPVDGG